MSSYEASGSSSSSSSKTTGSGSGSGWRGTSCCSSLWASSVERERGGSGGGECGGERRGILLGLRTWLEEEDVGDDTEAIASGSQRAWTRKGAMVVVGGGGDGGDGGVVLDVVGRGRTGAGGGRGCLRGLPLFRLTGTTASDSNLTSTLAFTACPVLEPPSTPASEREGGSSGSSGSSLILRGRPRFLLTGCKSVGVEVVLVGPGGGGGRWTNFEGEEEGRTFFGRVGSARVGGRRGSVVEGGTGEEKERRGRKLTLPTGLRGESVPSPAEVVCFCSIERTITTFG